MYSKRTTSYSAVTSGGRGSNGEARYKISSAAKNLLLEKGYNREMGARPMRRTIEKEVEDAIAERLLSGEFGEGSVIKIAVSKGKLTFNEVDRKKVAAEKIKSPSKKDSKVKEFPVT